MPPAEFHRLTFCTRSWPMSATHNGWEGRMLNANGSPDKARRNSYKNLSLSLRHFSAGSHKAHQL